MTAYSGLPHPHLSPHKKPREGKWIYISSPFTLNPDNNSFLVFGPIKKGNFTCGSSEEPGLRNEALRVVRHDDGILGTPTPALAPCGLVDVQVTLIARVRGSVEIRIDTGCTDGFGLVWGGEVQSVRKWVCKWVHVGTARVLENEDVRVCVCVCVFVFVTCPLQPC